MKTNNLVSAVITSGGAHFCLAKSRDGREFFLPNQTGPMAFQTNSSTGVTDFTGQILLERRFDAGAQILLRPGMKTGHGNIRADAWGLLIDAKSAHTAFQSLPIYAVGRRSKEIGKDGKLGRWGKLTIIFQGTLDAMIRRSPRDGLRWSATDEFAPNYSVEGFVSETAFYDVIEGNLVQRFDDPRPFPDEGPLYRAVYNIAGCEPRILVTGTARKVEFEFPRREKNDILGCTGVTWLKLEGKDVWSICESDPRVPASKLTIKPKPLADLKSLDLTGHFDGVPSTAGVTAKKDERVPAGK